MPWESVLYVVVLLVVLALLFCNRPIGQNHKDRRVARLMRGGK